jgi:hypothetical protein
MYDAGGDLNNAINSSDLLLGTRQKITPYGYQVLLVGNKLQVLKQSAVVIPGNDNTDPQTSPPSNEYWAAVAGMYGVLRSGISQVRLDNPWDDTEIIGLVSFDPTDDRFLLFDVDPDTIPQNTLSPVDAVINPLLSGPGAGLPAASTGQRYLILEDIGSEDNSVPAADWGEVVAKANDIIEYDGVMWQVTFESTFAVNTQYVTNLTTALQYRWTGIPTGSPAGTRGEWVKSYEGLYPGGDWSLVL